MPTQQYRFYIYCSIFCSLLFLSACQDKTKEQLWEGQWQRSITVPTSVQGRCVHETLLIEKKKWQLTATLYPTRKCQDAFLEVVYQGELKQVKIKRNTQKRQMILEVSNLQLIGLTDISANERVSLSANSVKKVAQNYVPTMHSHFSQQLVFDEHYQQMLSNVYMPLQNIAFAYEGSLNLMYHKVMP